MKKTPHYANDQDRYTSDGFSRYWKVVDCTMQYVDTIYWKTMIDPSSAPSKVKRICTSDKYRWRSPNYEMDNERNSYGNPSLWDYTDQYDRCNRLPAVDPLGRRLPSPPHQGQ